MQDSSTHTPLPEKVVKRLYTLLSTLLPALELAVFEEQRALDNALSDWMRQRRELGSGIAASSLKRSLGTFGGWLDPTNAQA